MNIATTHRGTLAGLTPLKDKVALVTGSTSGIGLGIARAMAAAGAAVVLNGFGKAEEIAATQQADRRRFRRAGRLFRRRHVKARTRSPK